MGTAQELLIQLTHSGIPSKALKAHQARRTGKAHAGLYV